MTKASRITILSFALGRKSPEQKRLCFDQSVAWKQVFITLRKKRSLTKMTKAIVLSTVLGVSALGLACGAPAANNTNAVKPATPAMATPAATVAPVTAPATTPATAATSKDAPKMATPAMAPAASPVKK